MKHWSVILGWLLFPIFAHASCKVVDDVGNKIHLTHPAQRIISLAPDLTELLFEAGAGKHIVGVMRGSDFPHAAKTIPIVANFNSIDIEKILSLHPDLIVVWAEGNRTQSLKKYGIPIYYSHHRQLKDIPYTLQRFGCLAGSEKTARQAAEIFSHRYKLLRSKYADKKPVSVFYQVWLQPLITVTKQSWINDVLSLCGGKNIFANLKGVAPEVNIEAVLMANPEVIIGSKTKQDWRKFWKNWPQMQAVQNHHLFNIDPNLIERSSARVLQGADEICQVLNSVRD